MASKKSYWLKAGLFSLSERFSLLLFGFGSLFLLLRMLPKIGFGVWVLFLTVTSIIEVARIGLLQNALVKFLTTSKKEAYASIGTASLFLNLLLAFLSILLLLLIAYPLSHLWESPKLPDLLYIYCLTTVALIPLHQSNFTQQANLDFRGIFWANFTKQGLFFAYILCYFVAGWEISLIGLASFQVFTAACGALVSFLFGRKYLKFKWPLDWQWVKKLFHYGKFVFGTNLSAMLYKTIDKIMLGSLLNPIAVAIYELAIRITNLAEVPTFSIASIVFPQSARKMDSEGTEGVKILYEKSVGAILAFILPCILVVLLFPTWIIWIVAGEQYLDAAPILRLTMLYGLFVPFAIQFGTILDSIGQPKTNFIFTLLGAILNVVFNYLFISTFGLVGAAYGTLTTYTITFVLMQTLLYKKLNVKAYKAFYYLLDFYYQGFKLLRDNLRAFPKLILDRKA